MLALYRIIQFRLLLSPLSFLHYMQRMNLHLANYYESNIHINLALFEQIHDNSLLIFCDLNLLVKI